MSQPKIVVVDNDEAVRTLIQSLLQNEGYQVTAVGDGQTALTIIQESPVHVLIIDLKLPGLDGLEILESASQLDSQIVCIVMAGFGTVEQVVKAIRAGAFDFIAKPIQPDAVCVVIKKALEYQRFCQENLLLRKTVREQYSLGLPEKILHGRSGINLAQELAQFENRLIAEALRQANGVTSRAAQLLQMNRTTLVEKLKRKKLDSSKRRDRVLTEPAPVDVRSSMN